MKTLKHLKQSIYLIVTLLFLMIPDAVWARGEAINKATTGASNLINDIQKSVIIIVPLSAGLALLISAGLRSISNEEDKGKWDRRMKQAVIFAVVAVLAGAIVTTVLEYFK